MLLQITQICADRKRTLDYMISKGLLIKNLNCGKCSKPMKIITKAQLSDGVVWQCAFGCNSQSSVRKDSLFYASKIPLGNALLLLYFFCCDVPAYITHRLIGHACISYDTIIYWYEKYRELCSFTMIQEPLIFNEDIFLSQESLTVEIDESFMGKKAKNERGTSKQTHLVFGIVPKSGKSCALYLIPSANKETLLPIIEKHVPKTIKIHHDGWASYTNLHELGYSHDVVFHNREFVSESGVHTNTIEGVWGLIRQRIGSMHGLKSRERLSAHLDEFSFRQIHKDSEGSIWEKWNELNNRYNKWWAK